MFETRKDYYLSVYLRIVLKLFSGKEAIQKSMDLGMANDGFSPPNNNSHYFTQEMATGEYIQTKRTDQNKSQKEKTHTFIYETML